MDLQYTLSSLRQRWIEHPAERRMIEAQAERIHAELNQLQAQIPRSLAEHERDTPGKAVGLIEMMLLNLADFLNIGKNISPAQIQETAALLAAEFEYLTLEHFAVVIQRAKLGQWGQVYDRLDGQVVAGWLRRYVEELQQSTAELNHNQHLATKQSRAGSGDIYRLSDLTSKFPIHDPRKSETNPDQGTKPADPN